MKYHLDSLGVFYINSYGHEIQPWPNPEYLSQLNKRDILVYSCGSLWTRLATVVHFLIDKRFLFLLASCHALLCKASGKPLLVQKH